MNILFDAFLLWKFSNLFSFIPGGQFLLPQRANNGKGEFFQPKKVDETAGFQYLGHSNWTSCIPLNHFCSGYFPICFLSYWEANSYYPRGPIIGKWNSSNLDETAGFKCLGHSNWASCIPLNPLYSGNFPICSLSYWEANSYYPRWPITGKGNSSNPKK